jgi:hypothetical protein
VAVLLDKNGVVPLTIVIVSVSAGAILYEFEENTPFLTGGFTP